MVHFGMCQSANPVILLRLFPSLAPAQLLRPVEGIFPGTRMPAPEPHVSLHPRRAHPAAGRPGSAHIS